MISTVNFHQVSTFLEKATFWDYCENELIFLRYVLKSFSLSGVLPQGLLFPRNIHSCRIYWCPSAAECKSSLYFSISRGVFEGRCHQVPKITIQNGPRQLRRSTGGVMGSSNPRPLEPLQINLFGELHGRTQGLKCRAPQVSIILALSFLRYTENPVLAE